MKTLLFDFAGVLSIPQLSWGGLSDTCELNQPLLKFLSELKKERLKKYLLAVFTNSLRSLEEPAVKAAFTPLFNHIFKARELGLSKSESNSYLELAKKLGCAPQEIFFADDSEYNIEAARQAGFRTYLFRFTSEEPSETDHLISELRLFLHN